MAEAIAEPAGSARAVAGVLHQAAFLHSALGGGRALDWPTAARWLLRGLRGTRPGADERDESDGEDPDGPNPPSEDVPAWEDAAASPCPACTAAAPRRRRPTRTATWDNAAGRRLLRPTAPQALAGGEVVAALAAPSSPALWLVAARRWWPAPVADPVRANCRADVRRCTACGDQVWLLRTTAAVACGDELVLDRPGPVCGQWAGCSPLLVTFDGAQATESRAGGAGAALRGPIDAWGGRPLLATAQRRLPAGTDQLTAEALAAGLALALLRATGGPDRRATAVGDNLVVIRACAGTRRAQSGIMDILDGPLMASLLAGWAVDWACTRRRENEEAHGLADTARDLDGHGTRVTWHDGRPRADSCC